MAGNTGEVTQPFVLAVGGSAGGVEALLDAVGGLPADLPACVLVTVHIGEQSRTALPRILSRRGPLPAGHARDGEPLRPGRIYVAPPGHHLLVSGDRVRLSRGPRINRYRPAVDAMFGSAARWANGHAIAAVLSGMLDDGAVGAALVARAGGQVLVQDPDEALFAPMPLAALRAAPGAVPILARDLGGLVSKIIAGHQRRPDGASGAARPDRDERGGERSMPERTMEDSGDPRYLTEDESRLTRLRCPDCDGPLAQLDLPPISYYRCHLGHQFAPGSLEAAQREAAEARLWSAVATLEEHAALARHLAGSTGPRSPAT